jgi:G3E family GTPase
MRSNHASVDQHSRISLTVVGGAPSTGKTTLVRHLLEYAAGRRLAAVLASEDAIAPELIARRDGQRVVLHNGCVCVFADDDGASALAALTEERACPDHVLLDSAGWTDPRRLSGYGYMPGYCLDGTIVVLDAATIHRSADDATVETQLREHARVADVVLLNKVDLAGDDAADVAQRTLERLAPGVRVVWCDHCRIAPALLLGAPDGPDAIDGRTVVAEWSPDYVPVRSRGTTTPLRGGRSPRGEQHRSWCLVTEAAVDGLEFRDWVHRLPPTILSGRGTVYLRKEPQHRQTFHLLGSRWRLERGAPWGRDVPTTRLLLAGVGTARHSSPETARAESGRTRGLTSMSGDLAPSEP